MRLAELPRAENRVILNRLYNGQPPFNADTAEENGFQVNRNFLEGPNLLSNARRQWNRAMLGTGNYFTVSLDRGPAHKRRSWSAIITKHINRALKRSPDYMEYMRGMGATTMLHGISPANYASKDDPIINQLDIDDLLIPSQTRLTFDNLDHFAIWRSWTPAQLYELTHGPRRSPGWNMTVVDAEIKRVAAEYQKNAYSMAFTYQPEKIEEVIKGDMGFWGSDATPTIDAWDFYFREADDGEGWYRRIILDSAISGEARTAYLNQDRRPQVKDQSAWLYTSNKRKYANSLREIIHCQFADTSAIAPFRYHSVRSLGYMLYGVCELQNRLRCQFAQSVFEQLMWFFRTSNDQQFQQIKKAVFRNMAVIPQGISWVSAEERFKPDANLVELFLGNNRQLMSESASSYTQDIDNGTQKEMTATETMARVNSVNALVSGMLALAYNYETYQYRETSRRFCIPTSKHRIVKEFRKACLKDGVPEELINVECWDVEPEKVLGGGNKILEIAQSDKLLSIVNTLDPESQQVVKHIYVEANTDDPALAEQLVPLEGQKHVSDATHDAELASTTLLMGLPMQLKTGLNHIDYIEAELLALETKIQMIEMSGGMAGPAEIFGLTNLAGVGLNNEPTSPNGITGHIQILAQDKNEQQRVKEYGDRLGKAMNMVKAYVQRLQEQQQQQNGNGQPDPEAMAKIQATMMTAQAKAANSREAHQQKTSQKQVAFELDQKRREQEHQLEMRRTVEQQQVDDAASGLKTAAEIRNSNAKSETTKTE